MTVKYNLCRKEKTKCVDVCLVVHVGDKKKCEISKDAEIDFLCEWRAVCCWKLEGGGGQNKSSRLLFGCTRVFFGGVCLYARATSRRLEPIWCTVAWQQNVSHCSESLSSGWCVTSCGGGGGAVCMALYAQVHLCATYLYSWIASPVWFVMYVSEGIRAYCALLLVDAYVFEYTAMCAVLRWLFYGVWLVPHSIHVVWFAVHVQYTSVIMWVYIGCYVLLVCIT